MNEPWEDAVERLSVLVDPVRRSMYRFVRRAGRPVSREEVADGTGTSVKLAAFHLDKLVEHGWLRTAVDKSPRSTAGGRPPKRYTATTGDLELSLPPRRYDLMGGILLEASQHAGDGHVDRARRAAYDRGFRAGEQYRSDGRRRRMAAERTLEAAVELFTELGFEPRRTETGDVVMANCPFRTLAETAPGTVCETATALAEGVIAGAGGSGVDPVCDRADDRCCVVLRRARPKPS